ncbi:hypothetical protein C2I33_23335, partial [Ralstonia solanacearum]
RIEYNTERPHSSLGYLTPAQFAQGHEQKEFFNLGLHLRFVLKLGAGQAGQE